MILRTKRLDLIPFQKTDETEFLKLNIDPFVRKYLWDDEIIDIDLVRELLKTNDDLFKNCSYGLWKAVLKEGQTVGYSGLWHFFEEKQPQLIYILKKNFTGFGYAREFSQAIIDYALSDLGFNFLAAATDEENIDSQRLAERLGMKLHEKRIEDEKETLFYRIEKNQ